MSALTLKLRECENLLKQGKDTGKVVACSNDAAQVPRGTSSTQSSHGDTQPLTASLGCRETLEKPNLVSAAPGHTWPLQPGEHTECSNCCDTGLNQGSTDSTGHRSWWLHLAPCESHWGQGKNWQDTGSSCQLCPEGFTTAINAQWLRVTHRSLRAASLQGNPGKLWAGNPGSFAVPQDLQ